MRKLRTLAGFLLAGALVLSGCSSQEQVKAKKTLVVERGSLVAAAPLNPVRAPKTPEPRTLTPDPPSPAAPATLGEKRYGWATGDNLLTDAATLTLVKGLTPRQALDIVAPKRATPVEGPRAVDRWVQAHLTDDGPYPAAVAVSARGGWTMVLEDNGFAATEVATRLGRHGPAVIIFNNVEADCSFQYARDGRVVRSFDPLLYDHDPVGERRLRQERSVGFGRGSGAAYIAQSLLLAERLTGLRIEPRDLQPSRYRLAAGVLI